MWEIFPYTMKQMTRISFRITVYRNISVQPLFEMKILFRFLIFKYLKLIRASFTCCKSRLQPPLIYRENENFHESFFKEH